MNWIPCSERIPDERVDVLIWSPSDEAPLIAIRLGDTYWPDVRGDGHLRACDVTHWMPLPEPPAHDPHMART